MRRRIELCQMQIKAAILDKIFVLLNNENIYINTLVQFVYSDRLQFLALQYLQPIHYKVSPT